MKDIRWHQRLANYRKALKKLGDNIDYIKDQFEGNYVDGNLESAALTINDIFKQGLIQSFEFTHELAWNVIKDFAEDQGISDIRGSKDATRYAAKVNLITEAHLWMQMIPNRNRTTHTYNEQTANEIFCEVIKFYHATFIDFEKKMVELRDGNQGTIG